MLPVGLAVPVPFKQVSMLKEPLPPAAMVMSFTVSRTSKIPVDTLSVTA
jgi:hypothetical protein